MPITKTGSIYKDAGDASSLDKAIYEKGREYAKGNIPRWMRAMKRPLVGTYNLLRGAANMAVRGTSAYGRVLGNRPLRTIPLTAAALYLPYKGRETFRKNFYHTDPNVTHTYSSPTGISYYDKTLMKQRNKNTNFLY